MAWLTEAELKTLEKKAGFIGVVHREGYGEARIEVQRLIDEYRQLKKECEDGSGDLSKKEERASGLKSGSSGE